MLRRTAQTLLLSAAVACPAWGADAAALWTGRVQPLFDVHCVKCHGPIEQKSGLELDTPAAVLKGGDDGVVVVPGKPEESRLYLNLAADADPHMPPKKQLTESERELVREWIATLAVTPTESAPRPATVRQFESVTQAVDTLIAGGWDRRRIHPTKQVWPI